MGSSDSWCLPGVLEGPAGETWALLGPVPGLPRGSGWPLPKDTKPRAAHSPSWEEPQCHRHTRPQTRWSRDPQDTFSDKGGSCEVVGATGRRRGQRREEGQWPRSAGGALGPPGAALHGLGHPGPVTPPQPLETEAGPQPPVRCVRPGAPRLAGSWWQHCPGGSVLGAEKRAPLSAQPTSPTSLPPVWDSCPFCGDSSPVPSWGTRTPLHLSGASSPGLLLLSPCGRAAWGPGRRRLWGHSSVPWSRRDTPWHLAQLGEMRRGLLCLGPVGEEAVGGAGRGGDEGEPSEQEWRGCPGLRSLGLPLCLLLPGWAWAGALPWRGQPGVGAGPAAGSSLEPPRHCVFDGKLGRPQSGAWNWAARSTCCAFCVTFLSLVSPFPLPVSCAGSFTERLSGRQAGAEARGGMPSAAETAVTTRSRLGEEWPEKTETGGAEGAHPEAPSSGHG